MPIWEFKYPRRQVNTSRVGFSFCRDEGAKRVPNYFTTAVPRSYFSIRLSLNISMTSEYQLAKKTEKNNKKPNTTHPQHPTGVLSPAFVLFLPQELLRCSTAHCFLHSQEACSLWKSKTRTEQGLREMVFLQTIFIPLSDSFASLQIS